ncbi:MAG: peptide chain release factor N(5)-glutamine methyltransferase [Actinobacteria bacterium]|nr:peptide chain release factor N(5)-glutamine methyltransferase [Actinomycetota bacterium]
MSHHHHAATTAAALVDEVTLQLERAGVATPRADARWLVRHTLGWSAAELTLGASRPLSDAAVVAVRARSQRRAAREPLQLVLGGTEFRGHPLRLWTGVFVPRPETELLVEHALAHLPTGGTVVEPCTGSGAVACAVGVERPDCRIIATDRDPAAVDLATRNAAELGATVDVRRGDLLDPVPAMLRGAVDVLVANPPYLAADEVADLPDEVAAWDPVGALVAGPSGHEISDRLIAEARRWLRPGGSLLLELDGRRVADAAERARSAGLDDVRHRHDLAGRPRFLVARQPR